MSINIVVRLSDANVGSSKDRKDVVLAHQEHFPFATQLELLTGVGGEQDNVADLDLELATLAILRDPALTDRDHLALLRLVLGGVGQNDPTGRRSLGLFPFNDDAIAQWLEFHRPCLPDDVRRDLTSMPAIAFPMAARSSERHAETRGRPITPPLYATAVPTKCSSSNHIASTCYVPSFQFSRVLLLPIEADNRPPLPFRQSSDCIAYGRAVLCPQVRGRAESPEAAPKNPGISQ